MASGSTKPTDAEAPAAEQKQQETKPAALGEDDEFEDFPVDGWSNHLPALHPFLVY